MELRKIVNPINYRALNDGHRVSASKRFASNRATKPERKPQRMITRLEHQINYNLYKSLKSKVTNRIVHFNIQVDKFAYNYFKVVYDFNNRFKQAAEIISRDFNLVHERMCPHNPRNRVRIDTGYFLIRLYKRKDIVLEDRIINGPFFIYFKFGKLNEILW